MIESSSYRSSLPEHPGITGCWGKGDPPGQMKALDPHRVTTVTDPAVVENGVATIDGAVVEGLELVVVLVDVGAMDFLRDGTVDDTLVGTIVVVADFAVVGFTVGVVKLGEAIIDGLNDEPLDVGKSVVLIVVDC